MRLIYPVIALAGFLAISGCAHHNGAHQGGHGFAAKNYGLTYEQVREAAQDGDADAQYALGYMYYYGQNVTRNGKQARYWIAKAASQNHQQAIRALKMMGSEQHYASRDTNWNESARTAPLRTEAGQANQWQEVRRPQATNQENLAPQAKPEQQAATGKSSKTAVNEKTSDKHQKAQKVAELRKKHTQAALHKKGYNKQLASKKHGSIQSAASNTESENSEAANDASQSDEATEQNQATKGKKSAQAGNHPKHASKAQIDTATADADETMADSDDTAQEAPSLKSAQQKVVQPAKQAALKGNKAGKGQFANAKGAKLTSDERSILSAPASHYTLQLMGSGSKASIQKLIANNHIQQKAKVYHTTLKGKDYYVLIYGSYPSQAAANAAIAHLPSHLQDLKPWAKPYTSVKSSIKTASSGQTSKHTS